MERKFMIGDYVHYGTNGICLIKEVKHMRFAGMEKCEYYILVPNTNTATTIYIPTQNRELVSKMRHILTADQAKEAVTEARRENMQWDENRKERAKKFEAIVSGGDPIELLRMIYCCDRHRASACNQRKIFSSTDINYIRQAESIVENEFSFALGVDLPKIKEYIYGNINDDEIIT